MGAITIGFPHRAMGIEVAARRDISVAAATGLRHDRHDSRTLVDEGPLQAVGDGHPLDKPLDRGIGRHNLITTEKIKKYQI